MQQCHTIRPHSFAAPLLHTTNTMQLRRFIDDIRVFYYKQHSITLIIDDSIYNHMPYLTTNATQLPQHKKIQIERISDTIKEKPSGYIRKKKINNCPENDNKTLSIQLFHDLGYSLQFAKKLLSFCEKIANKDPQTLSVKEFIELYKKM